MVLLFWVIRICGVDMARWSHLLGEITLLSTKDDPTGLSSYLLPFNKLLMCTVIFFCELFGNYGASFVGWTTVSYCSLVTLINSGRRYWLVVGVLYRGLFLDLALFRAHIHFIFLQSHRPSSIRRYRLQTLQYLFMVNDPLTNLLSLGLYLLHFQHILLKSTQGLIVNFFVLHGGKKFTIDNRNNVLCRRWVCTHTQIEINRGFHRLVDLHVLWTRKHVTIFWEFLLKRANLFRTSLHNYSVQVAFEILLCGVLTCGRDWNLRSGLDSVG